MEENEELETYQEVPTEYDYEDDFAAGDYFFVGFFAILICAIFAFVVKTVSKHLKNVNLKIGNKIEIGVESKDNPDKK